MRNKQPFYYRVDGLLFTLTEEIDEEQFKAALIVGFKATKLSYIKNSLEIEQWGGGEPGDPADL
jgi:hypothetical protein